MNDKIWYEVKGYSKSGVYAHTLQAWSKEEALKIAKPILHEMSVTKIKQFIVTEDHYGRSY